MGSQKIEDKPKEDKKYSRVDNDIALDMLVHVDNEMKSLIHESHAIVSEDYSLEPDYKLGYFYNLPVVGGQTPTSQALPSPCASILKTVVCPLCRKIKLVAWSTMDSACRIVLQCMKNSQSLLLMLSSSLPAPSIDFLTSLASVSLLSNLRYSFNCVEAHLKGEWAMGVKGR